MKPEQESFAISNSQKKRIFQWEIPHLIFTLKKEQGLVFTHLSEPLSLPPGTTESFVFNGHTGFPLFAGRESLGLLLCFNNLNERQKKYIRQQIDLYLQDIFSLKKDFSNIRRGKEKTFSFPLLLRNETQSVILKKAYKIYLKTPSFAFVNAEDLNWQKGLFKSMNGVFVCIPFFHQLSFDQKQILKQEISHKKLPCRVVMGLREKDTLPEEWQAFFHISEKNQKY